MDKFDKEKPPIIDRRWPVFGQDCTTHVVLSCVDGKYYATYEDMDANGQWHYRKNSSRSIGNNIATGLSIAERMWSEEKERLTKTKKVQDKYARIAASAQGVMGEEDK